MDDDSPTKRRREEDDLVEEAGTQGDDAALDVFEGEEYEIDEEDAGLLFLLPVELFQMVLGWLKPRDLIRLTHASRGWRARVLALLHHYRLRSTQADHIQSVLVLSHFLRQRAHPLACPEDEDEDDKKKKKKKMKKTKKLKKKAKKQKSKHHDDDEDEEEDEVLRKGEATLALWMQCLGRACPRLRSLDLSLVRGPAEQLAEGILSLPATLTTLRLAYCGLEGAANLDHLHRLTPGLTRLDVSHCQHLESSSLHGLPPGLLCLKAVNCRRLSLTTGLLSMLPASLTELDLRQSPVQSSLVDGGDLPRGLRSLKLTLRSSNADGPGRSRFSSLFGTPYNPWAYKVPDVHILKNLPDGLERLHLVDFGDFLQFLPCNLQRLTLERCTNLVGLDHLPTGLRALDLTGCRRLVSPDLRYLTALEELRLDQWKEDQNPSGKLLQHLPSDRLRVLSLRLSTAVRDQDLASLPLCVQVLDVWGCDYITQEAIEDLPGDLVSVRLPNGTWLRRATRSSTASLSAAPLE